MNYLRVALWLLVALVAVSQAKGTVFVDTVYSSADRKIVIDNLLGEHAEATSVSTYQVGFNAFNALSVSAPELVLEGSFVSLNAENDILFGSSNSSITLGQGSDFNVNSKLITLIGNEVNVTATNGGINMLSRNTIFVEAPDINLQAGNGGLDFTSVAGSLTINAEDSLFLNSTNFHGQSHGDITTSSVDDTLFVASGALYVFTEAVVDIDSSTSVTIVSGTQSVEFNSDYITLATRGLNATGFSEAHLRSINDEVRVFGFDGTFVSADGINIEGTTTGVRFTVSGGNSEFGATADRGTIFLSTSSAGDSSEISLDTSSLDVSLSRDWTISSTGETFLANDFHFALQTDTFASQVAQDGYLHSSSDLSFTAGTSFGITSNTIFLLATDNGVPSESSIGDIHVAGTQVSHKATQAIYINTNDYLVDAGLGGINFAARDVQFIADSRDASDQFEQLNANEFSLNSRDLYIDGGAVQLNGGSSAYVGGSDFKILANQYYGATVEFSSKDSNWNVRQWNHDCGDCIVGPSTLSPNQVEISNFRTVSFSNGDFYDINVLLRDLTFTTADDFDYTIGHDISLSVRDRLKFSSGKDTSFQHQSLTAQSDSFLSDSGKDTTFSASDITFLTYRNEPTNDSMTFEFSNTAGLTTSNFQYNAVQGTTDFVSDSFVAHGESIVLESGDGYSAYFNAGTFDFNIANDLAFVGNSLEFISGSALTLAAFSDIDIATLNNGVSSQSGNQLFISAADELIVDVSHELSIDSVEDATITTQSDIVSDASGDTWIHSDEGKVIFSVTNAGGSGTFSFGGNATIATGDNPGDLFSLVATTLALSASDQIFIDISNGPLEFNVKQAATFESDSVEVTGDTVSFSSSTLDIDIGEAFNFYGGNVNFTSTLGSLQFTGGNYIALDSYDTSLAGKELHSIKDGLYFDAQNRVTFKSNSLPDDNVYSTDWVLFSRDALVIQTESAFGNGNIIFQGTALAVTSGGTDEQFENQDLTFSSNAELLLTTETFDGEFDYDFIIHAAKSATFNQGDFYIDTSGAVNITSIQGNFVIDHEGEAVRFVAVADLFPSEENQIQVNSTRFGHYDADGSLRFTSAEVSGSARRRGLDGDSNSEAAFDSLVGFSVRTFDELGDIDIDSLQGTAGSTSQQTTQFKTDALVFVDTLFEQTFLSGQATMEAEDGLIWYRGATEIQIASARDVNFKSYQFSHLYADENIALTTQDDWDVNAYESHISIINYEQTPISIESTTRAINVIAGSKLNVEANGDISWSALNSGKDWVVQADRGYSLRTSSDGITATLAGKESLIQSSEEFNLLAGGDLLLSNAGVAGERLRFLAQNGVVWQTRAGDIQTTSDNTFISAATIEFNAIGTSDTGRDQVSFRSITSSSASASDSLYIDAAQNVALGDDTNPSLVSIQGQGDANAPGVELNIAGNVEFDSDTVFSILAKDMRFSTMAQNTFTAGTTLAITSADQYISAPEGNLAIRAAGDFVVTGNNVDGDSSSISDVSDELNLFQTGAIQWISNQGAFKTSAGLFNTMVSGAYTTDVLADSATITTTRPDGELEFQFNSNLALTSATELNFSADHFMNFLFSDTTFTVTADTSVQVDALLRGSLELSADHLMRHAVTGDATFTGNALEWSVTDFNAQILVNSDTLAVSTSDEGDLHVFTQNQLSLVAGTEASFTAAESFRLLADGSVTITAADRFDIISANLVEFYVQPRTGREISITAPVVELNTNVVDSGIVSFEALKGRFHAEATGSLLINNAEQVGFGSHGEAADLVVNVENAYTIDTDYLDLVAGTTATKGFITVQSPEIALTATNFFLLTLAGNTQPHSPIAISGTTHTYTISKDLNVAANDQFMSQNVEDLGTVVFTGANLDFAFAKDVLFHADQAQIRMNSRQDVTFESASTITQNTHGVKSGVRLEANSFDFAPVTDQLSVGSGRQALFSVDGTESSTLTVTTKTLSVFGLGTSPNAGASVQMRTQEESGAISINADTLTQTAFSIQYKAQTQEVLSANQISITGAKDSDSKISVIAKGVSYDIGLDGTDPFGLQFTALDSADWTFNFFEMETSNSFEMQAPVGSITATGLFRVESAATIDIDVASITVTQGDLDFIARQRGISVNGLDSNEPLTIETTAGFVQFNAGLWEDNSVIRIASTKTSGGAVGNTFSATGTMKVSADSNILVKSRRNIVTSAATTMDFIAVRGDILFRSISMDHNGATDGNFDLTVDAPPNTGEILFSPMQRFAHRQHFRLAFFNPAFHPGRPGGADAASAQSQYTNYDLRNNFSRNNLPFWHNDCACAFNGIGVCAAYCIEASERAIQMQDALLFMGFMWSDPIDTVLNVRPPFVTHL